MRKPVVGWLGFYEVDECGNVFSVARIIHRADGTIQTFKERKLKNILGSSGYLVVRLSSSSKRKMARVHRLVAEAHLENPQSKPEVNHLDGDRSNPRLDNLEWVTSSENSLHALHILRSVVMPRSHAISDELARKIHEAYIPGVFGQRQLAMSFGVSKSVARGITRGHTYRHLFDLPPPPESEPVK
jgi:hypothetical protein